LRQVVPDAGCGDTEHPVADRRVTCPRNDEAHGGGAYSMGQIIKSVCICQCVCQCVCVRLWGVLSLSHFLIDFNQNWHRRKNPQKYNRVCSSQHRTTPYLSLPPPKK